MIHDNDVSERFTVLSSPSIALTVNSVLIYVGLLNNTYISAMGLHILESVRGCPLVEWSRPPPGPPPPALLTQNYTFGCPPPLYAFL